MYLGEFQSEFRIDMLPKNEVNMKLTNPVFTVKLRAYHSYTHTGMIFFLLSQSDLARKTTTRATLQA